MKYKYCPRCKKAFVRSRLEKDQCIYCNGTCETVNVRMNGMYVSGYSLMIAGAISVVVPRLTEVSSEMPYWALGFTMVGVGVALALMGSVGMARAAVEIIKQRENE